MRSVAVHIYKTAIFIATHLIKHIIYGTLVYIHRHRMVCLSSKKPHAKIKPKLLKISINCLALRQWKPRSAYVV